MYAETAETALPKLLCSHPVIVIGLGWRPPVCPTLLQNRKLRTKLKTHECKLLKKVTSVKLALLRSQRAELEVWRSTNVPSKGHIVLLWLLPPQPLHPSLLVFAPGHVYEPAHIDQICLWVICELHNKCQAELPIPCLIIRTSAHRFTGSHTYVVCRYPKQTSPINREC